jgi:TIR domain
MVSLYVGSPGVESGSSRSAKMEILVDCGRRWCENHGDALARVIVAVLVISYSRVDQPQVKALVSLLKASLHDVERAVFWDEQFDPGEPWFEQLKTHIDAAPQLFVFWCDHSNASAQVRREFAYALDTHKRVVPILLDNTPLVAELAPIHGIDLRGAIRHGRAGISFAVKIGTLIVTALVAGFAFSASYIFQRAAPSPAPSAEVTTRGEVVLHSPVMSSSGELTDGSKSSLDTFLSQHGSGSEYILELQSPETVSTADVTRALVRYIGGKDGVVTNVRTSRTGPGEPSTTRIVLERDSRDSLDGPVTGAAAKPTESTPPVAIVLLVLAMISGLGAVWVVVLKRKRKELTIIREFARHLRQA